MFLVNMISIQECVKQLQEDIKKQKDQFQSILQDQNKQIKLLEQQLSTKKEEEEQENPSKKQRAVSW